VLVRSAIYSQKVRAEWRREGSLPRSNPTSRPGFVRPFPKLSEEEKASALELVKDMHVKGQLRQQDPANPGIALVNPSNPRRPV
jgi:hypothetical protein